MLKILLIFSIIKIIYGNPIPSDQITFAKQSDSPWTVWMQIGVERRCTGSLINNEYILTAAHCFDSDGVEYEHLKDFIKIYIGDWKTDKDPDCDTDYSDSDDDDKVEACSMHTVAEIPPEKLFIHEEYSPGHTLKDIALVKLLRPPRKSRYIKNIELRTEEEDIEEGTMTVTGFGEEKPMHFTTVKKLTEVNIMKSNDCQIKIGRLFNEEYHFCGLVPNGITTCKGDSGGPVTSKINGKHILEGIVGLGFTECRGTNTPSIFLKVAPFAEWIEQTIQGKIKDRTTTPASTSTTEEQECADLVCD